MQKIAAFIPFIAMVSLQAVAALHYPHAVTGAGLIGQFYGPVAMSGKQRTYEESRRYEIARAYISGVKDGSEGKDWCHLPKLKPDELDSMLISDLRQLPPQTLEGVAAPLLVAALKKRFPCPPGRSQ